VKKYLSNKQVFFNTYRIKKQTYEIENNRFQQFKGDFIGGLVAGVVALPLALAFGVQSGMGRQLVYMEQSW
jgi:MFS superfamily sulfate permease-like transporter